MKLAAGGLVHTVISQLSKLRHSICDSSSMWPLWEVESRKRAAPRGSQPPRATRCACQSALLTAVRQLSFRTEGRRCVQQLAVQRQTVMGICSRSCREFLCVCEKAALDALALGKVGLFLPRCSSLRPASVSQSDTLAKCGGDHSFSGERGRVGNSGGAVRVEKRGEEDWESAEALETAVLCTPSEQAHLSIKVLLTASSSSSPPPSIQPRSFSPPVCHRQGNRSPLFRRVTHLHRQERLTLCRLSPLSAPLIIDPPQQDKRSIAHRRRECTPSLVSRPGSAGSVVVEGSSSSGREIRDDSACRRPLHRLTLLWASLG